MTTLIHDGTMEGLLTAVFESYSEKLNPDYIASKGNLQTSFDNNFIFIDTDYYKSDRVKNSIVKNGCSVALLDYAFSSGNPQKDLIIYNYLKLLFVCGKLLKDMLNKSEVIAFNNLTDRVLLECHRLKGFLRFNEAVGNIYYAKIEPDNNIVKFIMPHFTARYSGQKFLIHDTKRNIVGIHDTNKTVIFKNSAKLNIYFSENEAYIQDIFKLYYNTINISQRQNKKLMLNFMPKRYQKQMFETN